MQAGYGNFELPLVIPQRRSPGIFTAVSAAHAGALLCVLGSAAPMTVRIASTLCLLCSYAWQIRRFLRQSRFSLQLSATGAWRLLHDDGGIEDLRLLPGTYVQSWLVVLRFRGDSGPYAFVLTRDNTGPDVLRRLGVRLRFGAL